MQAVLQMSAGGPYSAPIRTSRALYCLVWMSSVKCLCWKRDIRREKREEPSDWSDGKINERKRWPWKRILTTQHAFPRSAIFTLILSAFWESRGLRTKSEALNAEILKKENQLNLIGLTAVCVNAGFRRIWLICRHWVRCWKNFCWVASVVTWTNLVVRGGGALLLD